MEGNCKSGKVDGIYGRHRFLKTHPLILTIVGLIALSVAIAPSVGMAEEDGGTTNVEVNNALSTSPILDMFTWWNLEYERKIGPTGTIGLTGSFIDLDDDENFKSISAFYRFYPQESALMGFFFGGRMGVYNVEHRDDSETVYGFGIDIAYSWLLGKRKSFSVSFGIGAVRLFGGDLDTATTLPTIRLLNIGLAF